MPILAAMITAGGGRFVPPMTIARAGQSLSAGQFKITDYSASFNYTTTAVTGGPATRTNAIVQIATSAGQATSQATVQAFPPKGITGGTVINVARTPYTYYGHNVSTPYCQSHYGDGQCAQGVSHNTWAGPYKGGTPANYTDSEGEWWRIW
jgi:hypothetical protein